MNKTMIVALFLLGSCAGCTGGTWSHWLDTRPVNVPVTPPASDPLPSGPITAEVVEPANAHRVALAVWDEMDRDLQKDVVPESAKESKKR